MRPFLLRFAELLLARHPAGLARVAIVLPGKRAGLHLRKYLAQAHGGAMWSPEILDVGSFLQRLSGFQQGTTMELLFMLHDTYRHVRGAEADALNEFLEWGPTTLRDLSEVDSHLLDIDPLYKDLRAYHELDEWSFRLGELSATQQRTNAEWRATGDLHRAFHVRMDHDRIATSGYIARICAERAMEKAELPWDFIWFAGLNALDPSTTAIIERLKAQGLAEVAWDADTFYLDDEQQEAGRYLRRSIAQLGPGALPPISGIVQHERTVRLINAPHPLAEAAYAAQRLAELSADERTRTAVVLAQEDLLFPLLERLPAHIGPVNVTMGLPLKGLPAHALAESLLDVLEQSTEGTFAVRSLLALFSHPFVKEGDASERILDGLRTHGRLHIEREALLTILVTSGSAQAEPMARALAWVVASEGFGQSLAALFEWASACVPVDAVVREQLNLMARVQQRLDRLLGRANVGPIDLRAYRTIRERVLREERLSFLGEPLRGLQVMGALETRSVDHERILFVGANEGTLPRTDAPASWIPFDLRKHHRLPLPADAGAVTAYNFQRAMQCATHVEWTTSVGDGMESNEPSRFITQWRHEVIGHSKSTLEIITASPRTVVRGIRPISVEKDANVMRRLHALFARGLSPSALGTWLRCPLDFYFKYIAGIREPDVVQGKLGSDVLGNAVHNTLQRILTPMVGKVLDPAELMAARERTTELLSQELAAHIPLAALEHGHYRLRRDMASKALYNHLQAEAERCAKEPTRLLAVELEVQAMLSNGTLIKGRCDRIDERDGRATVLDVKTGAVRDTDLRLAGLSRDRIGPNDRYALQLLIYLLAYLRQHPEVPDACAGVIPLQRATQAGGEFLRIGGEPVIRQRDLPDIEALLVGLVNELSDPTVAFTHDPESTYCRMCVA